MRLSIDCLSPVCIGRRWLVLIVCLGCSIGLQVPGVPAVVQAQDGWAVEMDTTAGAKSPIWITRQAVAGGPLPRPTRVELRLAGADPKQTPPVAGTVTWEEGRLRFQPRYGLVAGQNYRLDVIFPEGRQQLALNVPATRRPAPTVETVYPTGPTVPENVLRFYIQFSQPMRRGDIYEYLEIQREDGTAVELPFLEIEQELWSRDRRRLTLLIDPGRIKRGLKPREEMGPVFEAGQSYELVIKGSWPDAFGRQLGEDIRRKYKAIEPDQRQPDPKNWTLKQPEPGTRNPLILEFPEPLDAGMLQRMLVVGRIGLADIVGEGQPGKHERSWVFTPAEPWTAGDYEVRVDNLIEDLAGNSIEKIFDVDLFDKLTPIRAGTSVLEFSIGGADNAPTAARPTD